MISEELPPELRHKVIEYLLDDVPALCSLSLVSRLWLSFAQPCILQSIRVRLCKDNISHKMSQLVLFLQQSPHTALYIQRLFLSAVGGCGFSRSSSPPLHVPELFTLVNLLPGLRQIVVEGCRLTSDHLSAMDRGRPVSIHKLVLRDITVTDVPALQDFLSCFTVYGVFCLHELKMWSALSTGPVEITSVAISKCLTSVRAVVASSLYGNLPLLYSVLSTATSLVALDLSVDLCSDIDRSGFGAVLRNGRQVLRARIDISMSLKKYDNSISSFLDNPAMLSECCPHLETLALCIFLIPAHHGLYSVCSAQWQYIHRLVSHLPSDIQVIMVDFWFEYTLDESGPTSVDLTHLDEWDRTFERFQQLREVWFRRELPGGAIIRASGSVDTTKPLPDNWYSHIAQYLPSTRSRGLLRFG